MPHGHCYMWKLDILLLHIISDALITLSYYSIPVALIYFIKKRTDLRKLSWVFHLFAAFIFLCGTTHILEIYAVWKGAYYLTGTVKALTAIVSVLTAIKVIPLIPSLISIPATKFTPLEKQELMDEVEARKQTEMELREFIDRFENVFNSIPYPTLVLNQKGLIENINQIGIDIFEHKKLDLLNRHFSMLFPERYQETAKDHVENFFKNPIHTSYGTRSEIFAVKKSLTEFPTEVVMNPFKESNEFKAITIFVDTTERKERDKKIHTLNQELEFRVSKRTVELELANKELESFSYTVSHDLRAPLRHISGFLSTIEKSISDPSNKQLIEIVKGSVGTMGNLIDDLLMFSRTSRQELTINQVDKNAMIKSIKDDMDEQFNQLKIKWDIQKDLHPCLGDINLLKRVWVNLISNAIKYSQKSELIQIKIRSVENNDHVLYTIQDNGVGFDEDYKEKMFKVFERLHDDSEFEGAGVGLAIVKKIIDRHDGKIDATSKINKGSTFSIWLKGVSHA